MGQPLNRDAFTSQLVAVQRRLYAYILTLLPNLADADDVLQETNTVLLRKSEEYQEGTEFGAWACRVAYFEVLALQKKHSRERTRLVFTDERLLNDLAGEADERFDVIDSPVLTRLEECMDKLNPLHRQILRFRYGNNLLAEQIAKTMGRSATAVRQLLYRIRTQLLKCAQDDATTEEKP
jgi:RNA polymerase sigma-70 factor, ECF subfamily